MEIKVLARRGTAVREIARQTGLSRNTVRRYLRDGQAGRYKQREPRPTKLDPFKGYLLERVAAARTGRPANHEGPFGLYKKQSCDCFS